MALQDRVLPQVGAEHLLDTERCPDQGCRIIGDGYDGRAQAGCQRVVERQLLAGLIMLAGDQWLRDRYWLAALIVTAVAGAVALWFAKRGLALLSPRQLAPDQTLATLQEDKEWLKRQLT